LDSDRYIVSILSKCRDGFSKQGLRVSLNPPDEEHPFHVLLVKFDEVSDADLSVVFEHVLFPIDASMRDRQTGGQEEPDASKNIFISQTFVVLKHDVPASSHSEVLKAVAKINTQLPIGSFGLFTTTNVLYLKFNTLVVGDTPVDRAAMMIDLHDGLILHEMFTFVNGLLAVVEGEETADEAFRNTPLLKE